MSPDRAWPGEASCARPLRSLLSALGVALGVAVLLAGLATNAGIEASVERDRPTTSSGGRTCGSPRSARAGSAPRRSRPIAGTPGVAVVAPGPRATDVSRVRASGPVAGAAAAGHRPRDRPVGRAEAARPPRSSPGRRCVGPTERERPDHPSGWPSEDGLAVGATITIQGTGDRVDLPGHRDPGRRRAAERRVRADGRRAARRRPRRCSARWG